MVGNNNDKNNKHLKYTPDEGYTQAMLYLDDESDYLDLLGISLKCQFSDYKQLQLVFFFLFFFYPLQQKQVDDT